MKLELIFPGFIFQDMLVILPKVPESTKLIQSFVQTSDTGTGHILNDT